MLLINNAKNINVTRRRIVCLLFLCCVYFVLNTSNVSSFTIFTTNNYYSNRNIFDNINNEIYPNQYISTKCKRKSFECKVTSTLYMSLKPAALLLMDSGKSLARCGELVIDYTKELELSSATTKSSSINYNNLGTAGAQIRNSGDCLAQVGASCRFKTGIELVIDELRECATCLFESSNNINSQIQLLENDDSILLLKRTLELASPIIKECSIILEATGEGIMKRIPIIDIGSNLVLASEQLFQLSIVLQQLVQQQQPTEQPTTQVAIMKECILKLTSSADTMKLAGNELIGKIQQDTSKSGRSFLKGGM